MTAATLLAFTLVAFIAIATPGPTVILALANGSRFGLRRSLYGMLGAVISDFVLVGAAAIGLGALLAASETLFSAVKWIGVAYLAYLGLMLLRSKGGLQGAPGLPADARGSPRAVFMKSFLVAVTNPKGYLFVSAFLPQFIDTGAAQAPQYLILAIAFAATDFVVMFAYAALGARAVRLLSRSGALWLDRICGAVMLALAGALAFYRRASA